MRAMARVFFAKAWHPDVVTLGPLLAVFIHLFGFTSMMIDSLRAYFAHHTTLARIASPGIRLGRYFARKDRARRVARYETFCRSLNEDPMIDLKAFRGTFSLDARSDVFFRYFLTGNYEPRLANLCCKYVSRLQQRDAIDVGANVGFFSTLFAKSLQPESRVLAVEPIPAAAARLQQNLIRNAVSHRVTVFEGALSDRAADTVINVIDGKEEYSSLSDISHPSAVHLTARKIPVRTETLDSLVHQFALRPGFLKLDVEGNEHLVLQGASEVLKKFQPIILSELNEAVLQRNGSSSRQIIELLQSYGYKIVDPLRISAPPQISDLGEILCLPA